MTGKRKRGEEAEPEDAAVVAPCKMARVGEDETDDDNALTTILPSLVMPHKRPITKEKR